MDETKTVREVKSSETAIEMCELIDTSMCNPQGIAFGGQIMKWMDLCACMCAEKFSRVNCVTAAVDDMHFRCPIKAGEVITLKSQVNRAYSSSMEVGCKVIVEDLNTGKIQHACSAYFTFVTLKKDGQKIEIANLIPDTDENKRRYTEALERRNIRLKRRDLIENVVQSQSSTSPANSPMMELKRNVAPKKSTLSQTVSTELVLPVHANHMETMFGGQAMAWMEAGAFISCYRFARKPIFLSTIDDIHFIKAIKVGDRVIMKAQVTRDFKNAIECESGEVEHALTAYMTFKALNNDEVPNVIPETPEDKRKYDEALGRIRVRLERKAIRTIEKSLSVPWTPENALQLVYSNIRGLMMVLNKSIFQADQWTQISNENGIQLLYQQTKEVTCFKAECSFEGNAQTIFNFCVDINKRTEWDVVVQSATTVEKIDGNNDIIHLIYKPRPNEKSRDFVLLRSWRADNKLGEYVISARSIQHSKYPPDEKCTRGEVLSSGWIIKQKQGDKKIVNMTYILQLGTKALSLAVGDMTGQTKVVAMSVANVRDKFCI